MDKKSNKKSNPKRLIETLAAVVAATDTGDVAPRKRVIKVPLLRPRWLQPEQSAEEIEAAKAKAQEKRDRRAAKRAKAPTT